MGPANMKRYQLFLWESTEWFPQKKLSDLFKKKQHSRLSFRSPIDFFEVVGAVPLCWHFHWTPVLKAADRLFWSSLQTRGWVLFAVGSASPSFHDRLFLSCMLSSSSLTFTSDMINFFEVVVSAETLCNSQSLTINFFEVYFKHVIGFYLR